MSLLRAKTPYGKFPFDGYCLVIVLMVALAIVTSVYSARVQLVSKILASSAPTPSSLKVKSQSCQSNNQKVNVKFDWDGITGSDYLYQVLVKSPTFSVGGWKQATGTSETQWTWVGLPHNTNVEWKVSGIYIPDWSTRDSGSKSFSTKNCTPSLPPPPKPPSPTCDSSFPENKFNVCYTSGTDFSGSVLGGGPQVSKINYSWGDGEVAYGKRDHISARWAGKLQFDGKYQAEGYADDGVIIMVGSNKVVDKLADDGNIWAQDFTSEVFEAHGWQNVKIWWNEDDGLASLRVNFVEVKDESQPPDVGGWDSDSLTKYIQDTYPSIAYNMIRVMNCESYGGLWYAYLASFDSINVDGTPRYGLFQFHPATWDNSSGQSNPNGDLGINVDADPDDSSAAYQEKNAYTPDHLIWDPYRQINGAAFMWGVVGGHWECY